MINNRAHLDRIDDQHVKAVCIAGCKPDFEVKFSVADEVAWVNGALIQNVTPDVEEDDRELLMSGTCGACWEALFFGDTADAEAAYAAEDHGG